jgi:hypothetical protein
LDQPPGASPRFSEPDASALRLMRPLFLERCFIVLETEERKQSWWLKNAKYDKPHTISVIKLK